MKGTGGLAEIFPKEPHLLSQHWIRTAVGAGASSASGGKADVRGGDGLPTVETVLTDFAGHQEYYTTTSAFLARHGVIAVSQDLSQQQA